MQSSNWIHSRLNECDRSLYIVPEMSGERIMDTEGGYDVVA